MRGAVGVLTFAVPVAAAGCTVAGDVAGSPAGRTRAAAPDAPATPPVRAAGTPLTAAGEGWLDGRTGLWATLAAACDDTPEGLDPPVLRGPDGLRECREGSAEFGGPNERLRPVRGLARRACRAYDAGAACFTRAARARSGSGVQRDLDCGFMAASRGGGPLGAAVAAADRLRIGTVP